MALSPEEEEIFAAIASELHAPLGMSRSIVTVSLVVVALGMVGASLLGAPGRITALFGLTFVVALSVGLILLARRDTRVDRLR